MKIKFVAILLFVVVALVLLSGCISVGDQLSAKREVNLIADWNAPSLYKPVSCTLQKGEKVEVVDISTLYLGSSSRETIIQVSSQERSCVGWGFPKDFRQ